MTRFGLSPPAEPRSAGFSVDTRMRLSARSLAAIGRAGCVRRQRGDSVQEGCRYLRVHHRGSGGHRGQRGVVG